MMETLSEFVGADMSDVDSYVLKQGSTMVSIPCFVEAAVRVVVCSLSPMSVQAAPH